MSFPPVLLDAAAGSHSNCDDGSSCILRPLLCSSICLCQLILSPPILHSLLKGAGSLDHQAFCCHTWHHESPGPFWSGPFCLLFLAEDVKWPSTWQPFEQQSQQTCSRFLASPEGPRQHLFTQSEMGLSQPNILMVLDAGVILFPLFLSQNPPLCSPAGCYKRRPCNLLPMLNGHQKVRLEN